MTNPRSKSFHMARRFAFRVDAEWSGWICLACCWRRTLPDDPGERATLIKRVEAEFDAHNCGNYKRQVANDSAA